MPIEGCYAASGFDVVELRDGRLIDPRNGAILANIQRIDDGAAPSLRLDKSVEAVRTDRQPILRIVGNRPMFLPLTLRGGKPVIPVPDTGDDLGLTLLSQRTTGSCR
jgi:hypothetical protein